MAIMSLFSTFIVNVVFVKHGALGLVVERGFAVVSHLPVATWGATAAVLGGEKINGHGPGTEGGAGAIDQFRTIASMDGMAGLTGPPLLFPSDMDEMEILIAIAEGRVAGGFGGGEQFRLVADEAEGILLLIVGGIKRGRVFLHQEFEVGRAMGGVARAAFARRYRAMDIFLARELFFDVDGFVGRRGPFAAVAGEAERLFVIAQKRFVLGKMGEMAASALLVQIKGGVFTPRLVDLFL